VIAFAVVIAVAATTGGGTAGQTSRPPARVGSSTAPVTTSATPSGSKVSRGRSLIAGAAWVSTGLGYRLIVHPSSYGRAHAYAAPPLALAEALSAADPTPLSLTATIRHSLVDQLHCHAVFASSKPRWDLEAWRPNVGYARTVLAACNP
jgi:Protein of unknown function (DUF2599)